VREHERQDLLDPVVHGHTVYRDGLVLKTLVPVVARGANELRMLVDALPRELRVRVLAHRERPIGAQNELVANVKRHVPVRANEQRQHVREQKESGFEPHPIRRRCRADWEFVPCGTTSACETIHKRLLLVDLVARGHVGGLGGYC
jgi:hypothetical protein